MGLDSALVERDQDVRASVAKGDRNFVDFHGLNVLIKPRFGFRIAMMTSSHDIK